MSESRARSRAAAGRRPLSRERIVRTALALLDRDGLEALSMRRLADELGVGTMTLYGHFRDKRALLEGVVAAAVADFDEPDVDGPLRERLRAQALGVRRMLVRHPALAEIRARQPIVGVAPLRISERVMRALLDAGFPRDEAAHAFRLLFTYVFGFAMLNLGERDARQRDRARMAVATLPRDDFPALAAAGPQLVEHLGDERQFEYGLERVLDGLEARLAELREAP